MTSACLIPGLFQSLQLVKAASETVLRSQRLKTLAYIAAQIQNWCKMLCCCVAKLNIKLMTTIYVKIT